MPPPATPTTSTNADGAGTATGVNTWRDRYWAAFNVNHQIDERGLLYANPSSEPATFNEIRNADGSYKRLDSSDLYKPFAAAPRTDGDPPAGNEDVILAMLAAP